MVILVLETEDQFYFGGWGKMSLVETQLSCRYLRITLEHMWSKLSILWA